MQAEIDNAAGAIWRYLNEHGELTSSAASPGTILFGLGPPTQVDDVLLLDVAELPECLPQRKRYGIVRRSRAAGQEPDPPGLAPRLLPLGSERRGEEAASQGA